jgi:DinB superfamily
MNKSEIAAQLENNYQSFIHLIQSLNDTQLCAAPEDKWSAIKQLDHLASAVSAVNVVFRLPQFIVKWRFGTANRPSKNYDSLVAKYHERLQAANRPPARFQPQSNTAAEREVLILKLEKAVAAMCKGTLKCSEKELDTLVLPHPLLGMLTLREMLYFTIYHAEFHEKSVKKYI